jgi:hypothetical protein
MNSSISQTNVSDRAPPSVNRVCPTVAPATQDDHAPAANVESSKRKPGGLAPRALSAGTRRWAGRRGRHSGKDTSRSSPSATTAGAGTTPRAHEGGTARASASEDQPEEARNRSVGKRQRSFSRRRDASGAWARHARPRPPLFALRRLGCASQLMSGVNYRSSRAPLGTASRLRGAPLSSPVVSSPSNTSSLRVGPRRCATPDRVTVVPLYSRGGRTSSGAHLAPLFRIEGSARASTALTSHRHFRLPGSARASTALTSHRHAGVDRARHAAHRRAC